MRFTSLAELLAMNGHGIYVWSSYGISVVLVVALIFGSRWRFVRWRQTMLQQRQWQQRQQAHSTADAQE